MAKQESCPLCGTLCTYYHEPQLIDINDDKQWVYWIECPVCGKYAITTEAKDCLRDNPNRKENLYIISGVTRNYYEMNKSEFMITSKMLREDSEFQAEFLSKAPKNILDKAALLLQYIARKSSHEGGNVVIILSQDYPICFFKNAEELRFYINHLKDAGDIKTTVVHREGYNLSLTAEGWRKVESLRKPNIESKQAFVAMWFDESMDEIFKDDIVSIEKDTGFSMFRVDKTHFINEKICDKIIAEIKKSRFLIADVTGQRQAVYFEAGYAMGMGLPIIWICKESEVNDCCFDTRQYPHIICKDAEDLRNQLKEKILATIGKAHS